MTFIDAVTIEADDPTGTAAFHAAAFGTDLPVRVRAASEPTSGLRGFTLSLIVAQPADADALLTAALEAGATSLKPASKSMLAKDAGVAPDGAGAYRLAIEGDAGAFTDPDGFAWEPVRTPALSGR